MKKIILYLGILFTYYVSIRFINSSINQDDFNFIHFNSVSPQTIQTHQIEVLDILQYGNIIQYIAYLIFVLVIVIYIMYLYHVNTNNTAKIYHIKSHIVLQKQEQNRLNIKSDLSLALTENLQARVKIIAADLDEVSVNFKEADSKYKLSVIQNLTQQLLQFLNYY